MSAKRYYITSTGPSDDCDAFAVEEYDHVRAGDHEWVKAGDHGAEVERLREALTECLDYLEPSFFEQEALVAAVVKRARAALEEA